MFTGLIQQVGRLTELTRAGDGTVLHIETAPWKTPLMLGESVAVQGTCLTVTAFGGNWFTADVLNETLSKTALRKGAVNLERALAFGDHLGGHLVYGHVDEAGTITAIEPRGRDFALRVSCSPTLARQTVMKGSIAIDGISLTVSALGDDWLEVNIIPTTRDETTLRERKPGDKVNLEGDIIGKYIARLCGGQAPGGITLQTLATAGFE